MVENADSRAGRRVVAWASVSMDGFTSGPGGLQHDTWLYEHAGQEATSAYFEGIWRGASTALLGRTNYEGFYADVGTGRDHDACTRCGRAALPPLVGTAPLRSLLEAVTGMRAFAPPSRVHRAIGRAGEPATRAGPPAR